MDQTTENRPKTKGSDEHSLKETILSTADEVRQKAQETSKQIAHETETRARRLFSDQRSALAREVEGFAKAFRDTGRNLEDEDFKVAAHYSEELAHEAERLAEYIREKDMSQIIDGVEDFGRRQPSLFFGSVFAVGLLLARFFKSSSPHPDEVPESNPQQEPRTTNNPKLEAVDYQKIV